MPVEHLGDEITEKHFYNRIFTAIFIPYPVEHS